MLQKFLAFLLALLLLTTPLFLIGCEQGDDTEPEEKDLYATPDPSLSFTLLDNGTWSVSVGDFGYKSEIVIPAEHEGRAVTEIAASGFSGAHAEKITIPDTIVAIGAAAFQNCTNLTALTLPDAVSVIPRAAFSGCIYLSSFTIPSAVTSIDAEAFMECTALTAINIPEGVTAIGDRAFYKCKTLATITLPSTLQTVGEKAFAIIGDKTLEEPHVLQYNVFDGDLYLGNTANPRLVLIQCTSTNDTYTLHESTRIIYDSAFTELPLREISLHDNVTDIGTRAFASCASLTGIYVPPKVKTIGTAAFYYCRALKTISGLTGITTIGDNAFAGCNKLTAITLGNGVTTVGEGVFSGTSALQTTLYENIYYIGSANNPYLLLYRVSNKNATSYTLHPDTKIIYPSAFANCKNAQTVTLPQGLTHIGRSAFSGCTSLLAPTIPDSVTHIADRAFYRCTSFYTVILPLSVTHIGLNAFGGCNGLTAITIPFVGENANGTGNRFFGHLFGASSGGDHLTKIPQKLRTLTVSGGTVIGGAAFTHCKDLEIIKLPASLKVVEASAFFLDKNIKQVHVTDLAAWCGVQFATADANPLTNGASLFLNGKKVTDLVIPEGVTEIAPFAFNGCKSITTLSMNDDPTKIGENAFENCTALTSATLSNSVTVLRPFAFYGCEALESITLPDELEEIGNSAFRGCKALKKITLPASLTRISDRAFKGCDSLTRVRFKAKLGWSVSQKIDEKGEGILPLLPARNKNLLTEKYVNFYWVRS